MSSPFKKQKSEQKPKETQAEVPSGSSVADSVFGALKTAGEADATAEAASRPVSVSIDVPAARRMPASGEPKLPTKSEHVTFRVTPEFKAACIAAAARRGLRLPALFERLMQAVIEQDRAAGLID